MLIGRLAELAELRRLAAEQRLVTVTGAGGVGKTRLAQQVAAELVDRFPDGVWWVDLAAVVDPDRVGDAVAAAAGLVEAPGRCLVDELMSVVRSSATLFVIDNCEHVLAAVSTVVQRLVDGCPGVHVIATSREPLGVNGETTWRAPSLGVPPLDSPAAPERLDAYDAVVLFVERARQARPNFTVTDANAAAVAQICQRLDGIALAIELAAARVRSLPVERLAVELDHRFRVLTGGARTAPPRQRTLAASSTGATTCSTTTNRRCCAASAHSSADSAWTPPKPSAPTTISTPTTCWTSSPAWSTRASSSSTTPRGATGCWKRSASTQWTGPLRRASSPRSVAATLPGAWTLRRGGSGPSHADGHRVRGGRRRVRQLVGGARLVVGRRAGGGVAAPAGRRVVLPFPAHRLGRVG